MPALPAITFLGLRGTAAWLAVGAAGVGGLVVARNVIPAIVGGEASGRTSGATKEGASFDVVAGLAKAIAESSGRVAIATLGPAASIATEGVRLAGDVTEVLGRASERQTSALADVTRESVRANTRAVEALLDTVITERAPSRPAVFIPRTTRNEDPRPATLGGVEARDATGTLPVRAPAATNVQLGVVDESRLDDLRERQLLAAAGVDERRLGKDVVIIDDQVIGLATGVSPLDVGRIAP
jgi:hypothetical protein